MSPAAMLAVVLTVSAAPVLWRVTRVLYDLSRCHFAAPWRRQGFALGYALLGALTTQMVIDAWLGEGVSMRSVGFVVSSSLLVLFDRRKA